MTVRLVTWAERPELADHGVPAEDVWPEYNLHGDVLEDHWERVVSRRDYQFALCEEGVVVAEGHTAPLAWDGDDGTLPDGIDAAIRQSVEGHRAGRPADTLCAVAAEVAPSARRGGLASEVLRGMREIAGRHGLRHVIAPVRPSLKERYPLIPIERYVTWRRDDGLLFDPWMRVHERLGARVATALPRSMRITGTVSEWEAWTDLALPESGTYVFPHGLAPVEVDRDADVGIYWEPNVWMVHPDAG